jgi:hypothetical protein
METKKKGEENRKLAGGDKEGKKAGNVEGEK